MSFIIFERGLLLYFCEVSRKVFDLWAAAMKEWYLEAGKLFFCLQLTGASCKTFFAVLKFFCNHKGFLLQNSSVNRRTFLSPGKTIDII